MDTYKMVTGRILEELGRGIPWRKPWVCLNQGAYNVISRRRYSLTNQMLLGQPGAYGTVRNWNSLGGRIRKGEKAQQIFFWKFPESNEEENDEGEDKKKHPILRYYNVFHVSQVEGVTLEEEPMPFNHDPIEEAESLITSYTEREEIILNRECSDRAFYSPTTDSIHVPNIKQYEYIEDYYSTIFHEMGHSTGSDKRLNRPGLKNIQFGSDSYAKEELIATIVSGILLNQVGMHNEMQIQSNASYIKGWMDTISGDNRLFLIACSHAEKAVKYILNEPIAKSDAVNYQTVNS